ncbi:MAG: STAS domain-containing protein [Solirubrobacterales bacterium]
MNSPAEREGQFEVSASTAPGVATFTLRGELDIATADQLTAELDALESAAGSRRVIDLSAVSFMDSTGLRVLIAANRAAEGGEYELIVVTGDSPARRVLELTRMDEHMSVVDALA